MVPEIAVPSTECVRRPLMFVLATNEENFGFVAFALENNEFFGDSPKSGWGTRLGKTLKDTKRILMKEVKRVINEVSVS